MNPQGPRPGLLYLEVDLSVVDEAGASTIALSFEDGPDPVWTQRILASLDASGARATFFVATSRAVVWPEIIERIRDSGHEIGLHGGGHVMHSGSTETSVLKDAEIALSVLTSQEIEVRLWLPRGGQPTPFSGDVARRLGLQLVSWTVDPIGDASGSIDGVMDRLTSELPAGSIVRAYDGFDEAARDAAACELSLEMVRPLADHLEARGYAVVPVGELASRIVDLTDEPSIEEPSAPFPV